MPIQLTDYGKAKRIYGRTVGKILTVSSITPMIFHASANPISYTISGNLAQSGTPAPGSPVSITECGDLVETGEHTGQYAIPITIGGQTQTVYVNEPLRKVGSYVDTVSSDGTSTQKIQKIVLNGTENWSNSDSNNYYMALDILAIPSTLVICTHQTSTSTTYINSDNCFIDDSGNFNFTIPSIVNDTNAFKNFLATEYANGTPVTIWYALATPVVEQAITPTITPQNGKNTINVTTTLAPLGLRITYAAQEYSEIVRVYDNAGNLIYNNPSYYDWDTIRDIVRLGQGPQYYPIGYIFYDNLNNSNSIAFQVVSYDHHFDSRLTAQGYTHSMTLCRLKADMRQFDAINSLLYITTLMPAGTYKFTIPNYDTSYGGNKTYYFTTTVDIPVGGCIVLNWPTSQQPVSVSTYASKETITALDANLTLAVWDSSVVATDLGTVTYSDTATTNTYGIFNHIHRARYGSNNYHQSGLRQLLNTNAAANTWWTPQTIFDRPYNDRTIAGFLSVLNEDLVNVLARPTITYISNNIFEYQSLDNTQFTLNTNYTIDTDKMFLLSHTEVNYSATPNVGSTLDYYINAGNDDRIKYRSDNNNVVRWWLRAPISDQGHRIREVYYTGTTNYQSACNNNGVVPACVIQ